MQEMGTRLAHLKKLREKLLQELPNYIDEYIINGHPEHCLPNLVSLSIKYIEGESVVLMLDEDNIAVSTRSACDELEHVTNIQVSKCINHRWRRYGILRPVVMTLDFIERQRHPTNEYVSHSQRECCIQRGRDIDACSRLLPRAC